MKKLLLLCLLILGIFSCQKHELANPELSGAAICGVADPLKNLPWLKTKIEESATLTDYCNLYQVTQGNYAGKTVYIEVLGGALCCTCGNTVYDCEGKVVFSCDVKEEDKIANKKVIWKRR
jgi:hypothetical protein